MKDQKPNQLNSEKTLNQPQTEKGRLHARDRISYCVSGVISRCRAGTVLVDQRECKYYIKSTIRDSCMHYIEALGGHCDCEAAQREARKKTNQNEDEI